MRNEPTNGLHPAGTHEIRALVKDMPAQHGITVVVSSHLLGEIDQMATHVGIIDHGKLVFQDSIEKLRARGDNRSLEDLFLDFVEGLVGQVGSRAMLTAILFDVL
ncbi:hypothetical protein [Alicyclobacillus fastidiosus]|uniref:hypothetical protein n=1 Tax=Alicyclobacillus fastidiosus TaxID=392011 RepID=UPI0023E99A43|nr:hypothetical protein [Alicyclobacillus fastidiosus]GMA62789.1 hypothetical protein GCM10025859_32290 [Alicyclobacillus fastidiosus]